jgi:hypothetical protein
MCSTTGGRLARIYRAIEELESRTGHGAGESGGTAGAALATPTEDPEGAADDRPTGLEGPDGAGRGAGAGDGVGEPGGRVDIPAGTLVAGANAADDQGTSVAAGDVTRRLAEIWAMIADADPELAQRLPRYLGPNQ